MIWGALAGGVVVVLLVLGGVKAGKALEREEWLTKESQELIDANARIIDLTARARGREKEHAAQMDTIGTWLAKETKDAEDRQRRAVAGARALVLRNQPACPRPGGSASGPPTAAASGGDGAPACELPATTVRDLFQLVGDADRDVRQLAACQQVIQADRTAP